MSQADAVECSLQLAVQGDAMMNPIVKRLETGEGESYESYETERESNSEGQSTKLKRD